MYSNLRGYLQDRSNLYTLGSALVVFAAFFFVSWNRLDPDFGWHLVTGKNILAHGTIPRHDTYTYSAPGHSWIDHEWGNDLILAIVYSFGGYWLSALLYSLAWTFGLLLMGWRSRIWVLILAAFAMLPYAGIRPVAWTVLLFALTYRILKSKHRQYRLLLPLVFLIWANLHAGFIAGLALVGYFALSELDLGLGVILLASVATTFINPYGYKLYSEIAATIFDPYIHKQIEEWKPFSITAASLPYVGLWVIGFFLYAKPRWRRYITPGPLLLAAGLSASRNLPLFVVATVGEFNGYVSKAIKNFPRPRTLIHKLMFGLCALFCLVLFFYVGFVAFYPYKNRLASYPVQEVAYLKRNPCAGHLFNDYNYGGYLIWRLPSEPVYIDGRMVTWTYYMNRYLDIIEHPDGSYAAQFRQYDIKCVLLGNTTANARLIDILNRAGWRRVVQANGAVLLLSP